MAVDTLESSARSLLALRGASVPKTAGALAGEQAASPISGRTLNVFLATIEQRGFAAALDTAWSGYRGRYAGNRDAFLTDLRGELDRRHTELRAGDVPASPRGPASLNSSGGHAGACPSPARSHIRPAVPGAAAASLAPGALADTSEAGLKRKWDSDASVRASFASFEGFAAYERAASSGRAQIIGGKQVS